MTVFVIEPDAAQLGDTVTNFTVTGEVVGVDTVGPAILVRWHDSRAMDVYSLNSPTWSCFEIVREDRSAETAQRRTAVALDVPLVTQCPDCGADVPTIFEHVGGCPEQPTCNHDGVNTESLAELLAQRSFAITAQSGVEAEESDLVPLAALKLPWGG